MGSLDEPLIQQPLNRGLAAGDITGAMAVSDAMSIPGLPFLGANLPTNLVRAAAGLGWVMMG